MKNLFALLLLVIACIGQSFAASTFHFDSPPGDYIGGGQTRTITDDTHTFSVSSISDSQVTIYMSNPDDISDFWVVQIESPEGQSLQPGFYDGATRYPFNAATDPGLDVFGAHRGCNRVLGSFVINGFERDDNGDLLWLDMSFLQHCEIVNPALTGTLVIDNRLPAEPLSIAASMDAEGAVYHRGPVEVSGTVACSVATTARVEGTITQQRNRLRWATGTFAVETPCNAGVASWVAEVIPVDGTLTKGDAIADLQVEADDPNYGGTVTVQQTQTVTLVPIR